jgi:hypothetical protein
MDDIFLGSSVVVVEVEVVDENGEFLSCQFGPVAGGKRW